MNFEYSQTYDGAEAPFPKRQETPIWKNLLLSPYHAFKPSEVSTMAKASDNVTWTQLGILIAAGLLIGAGALAWLRFGVSDLRAEVIGARNQIVGVRSDISGVRQEVARTNGKLDILIGLTRDQKK